MGLEAYRALLGRYDRLLDEPGWWLGAREGLVREADRLWRDLTGPERRAAAEYQWDLYRRRTS